jgi:uncharacterized membrane protein YeaQ/YmgE (transglycosylase-associated protein family)
MSLLWFLIIGVLAGWIAGELYKGHGFGLIGNLIVGVVGAVHHGGGGEAGEVERGAIVHAAELHEEVRRAAADGTALEETARPVPSGRAW